MAKQKESNILDIIQGIQQSVVHMRDSHEQKDIGMKREFKSQFPKEKANSIIDSRVMDGFGVVFMGDSLKITYHSEIKLKDVYGTKFENEIEQMIENIVSFLKKEYKKVTGNSLTLARTKEPIDIIVQSTSRVRSWVQASCWYKISNSNVPEMVDKDKEKFDEKFKNWIKQQEKSGKKPENVSI